LTARLGYPDLGFGVGLRAKHFGYILENRPGVDWFEIISENFMDSQGRPRYVLDQIAERYPIVMHGVSMSIGSTDPLNLDYLRKLKKLSDEIKAAWVSDHLCWTGVATRNSHDLLPIPYNEKTLAHVVERIGIVQDVLGRPLVLENPSSYVTFADSTIDEWTFLRAMAEESGCGLLVDVNNVYVSAFNHDWDAKAYLDAVPWEKVVQFHLAGHSNYKTHIIDTHDDHVIDPVWALYKKACELVGGGGGVSTLLEWDANIPEFEVLHAEVMKAKDWMGIESGESGESGETGSVEASSTASRRGEDEAEKAPHPLHHVTPEVE
jgi:uncharacterized protein (UPF0276 family)